MGTDDSKEEVVWLDLPRASEFAHVIIQLTFPGSHLSDTDYAAALLIAAESALAHAGVDGTWEALKIMIDSMRREDAAGNAESRSLGDLRKGKAPDA